jgi:conjugal transfer/entry exclusion protein
MSTGEEVKKLNKQIQSLKKSINEVHSKMWSLKPPIPRVLRGIIGSMSFFSDYCEQRREAAKNFYNRYRKKFAVRLFTWIQLSMRMNKIAEFQAQLEYYENWLNVADLTLSL